MRRSNEFFQNSQRQKNQEDECMKFWLTTPKLILFTKKCDPEILKKVFSNTEIQNRFTKEEIISFALKGADACQAIIDSNCLKNDIEFQQKLSNCLENFRLQRNYSFD